MAGTGQREEKTHQDRFTGRKPQQQGKSAEEGKGEADLQCATGNCDEPDLPEVLEREFKSYRKEQEDYPNLGKIFYLLLPLDNAQSIRSDNDTRKDICHKGRYLNPVKDHPDYKRYGKNNQDVR